MALTLYNTLTRKKELFRPIDAGNVRVYACGPTVYDYVHIGNGRMAVVFDLLFRVLRHVYGPDHVTYARNITDVDDKINARAAESGGAIGDLTETTARQYQEDVADRAAPRQRACVCGGVPRAFPRAVDARLRQIFEPLPR
jgi:cysteinyl-tRNA synthetase